MDLTARQQEIIEKAYELIATGGIQSLTIKNLAGAIEVSEPAIYRHFSSKYEILDALLENFKVCASEVLAEEGCRDIASLDKVEHFILDRYERAELNPNMAKVMFSEEIFQDDPRLSTKVLRIMHSHKDVIYKIIAEGQVSGEIRGDFDALIIFRIIFGPVRLLIKQWCLSGFGFNLKSEGTLLWEATRKMIAVQNVDCK